MVCFASRNQKLSAKLINTSRLVLILVGKLGWKWKENPVNMTSLNEKHDAFRVIEKQRNVHQCLLEEMFVGSWSVCLVGNEFFWSHNNNYFSKLHKGKKHQTFFLCPRLSGEKTWKMIYSNVLAKCSFAHYFREKNKFFWQNCLKRKFPFVVIHRSPV